MLSDFFIANLDEVLSLNSGDDVEKFPILYAKRIDTIKLETLDKLLTGESIDYGERLIKDFNDYEVLIFSIRKEFTKALIETDSDQLKIVAENWSKTEEWILDKEQINDLNAFLNELKKLAIQSKNENKDLFVIMSV